MPRHCRSCGRPAATLHRAHFDADADGRTCPSIDVCEECRAWYKERAKRVAASNRTRKGRRGR